MEVAITMKNIIIGVASLLILLAVVAAYQLSKWFGVSSGSKIQAYQNPKSAVLIMDMQKEFSDTAQKIIDQVNKAIEHLSAKNVLPVYIKTQYSGSDLILNFIRKNSALEGSAGVDFCDGVKIASGDIFTKDRMDAFANPSLDEFLMKNQIDSLYIAGLDGCYCVNKTVRAALNRGYKVTIISDATASKKEPEFSAIKEEFKTAGVNFVSVSDLIK